MPFKIKLCGITKRIIDKYRREVAGTNLVLPVPDIAYCNRILKRIAVEVGIDKAVTYYCARHTFATLAIEYGMPIDIIAKILGHTNTNMTRRYAKISEANISREIKRIGEILVGGITQRQNSVFRFDRPE